MGFLRNIIRALIIALIGLWVLSFLGYGPLDEWFNRIFNPSREEIMERAQKIGDFSAMNDEFIIEKVDGLRGYDALSAQHMPSGQKMHIVNPGDKFAMSPNDLMGNDAERVLKDYFSKIKAPGVSPEDLRVTKQGMMSAMGKEVPYAAFEGKSKALKDLGGMVAVVDGNVLTSTNDKGKYSQITSEDFYNNINNKPGHGRRPGSAGGGGCICD